MNESWRAGHHAGYNATEMLVQIVVPEGTADPVDYICGFMAGRRCRSDDDLIAALSCK